MNIARLERATGDAGIDVKLIGEIVDTSNRIMREIGLNPGDTTGRELYQALVALIRRDEFQARQLLKTPYVLINLGVGPISLNIQDVVENSHHDIPYEKRSVAHAQRKLRAELVRRYAEHERTHDDMVYNLAREIDVLRESDAQYPEVEENEIEEKTTMERPYILAVGDINTNAFIKMNEEHGVISTDEKGYTRLSIEMGGKIPYDDVEEFRAGECSPNAAVSMTRLGLEVDLMTWIGNDEAGKHMVEYLNEQGVGTKYITSEAGLKSNYHYVLRFGADRTKLQKFEDYSYQWSEPSRVPDWLYLGVLGEKTWPLHEAILDYLNRNPSVKLVFQPGMFHLMWGAEKMAEFYKKAEVVILNREEAAQVTGRDRSDIRNVIQGLHDLGVSIAVVTDGADGAYASDGSQVLFMPNYPDPAPPFERTGAGDAFASTLSAALALGEPLENALRWAPINSAYVVQKMGAQKGLLQLKELQGYLETAPEWYKAKTFEG
jgi:sugar/nucleoside kinase (ribokinase family)